VPPVRLLTYNVHGFRAGVDAVVAAVADEVPDVAFVNEVGRGRALKRFARWMGMRAASGLRLFRTNPNAVLVRPPWRILERRVVRFTRMANLIPRGLVLARAGHAGLRIWAGSVHLGLSDAERVRHAEELTDALAGLTGPVLLGGDLNEDPDRPAARWISERFWDSFDERGDGVGHTFPSADPRARIDYLFVSEGVRVDAAWVKDGPAVAQASDHLPVFADVFVGDGSTGLS